jgi:putative ABC transport system ATP-binding protein
MEKSLLKYIWTHTRSQQLWILLVVFISMIPYFLSLNLPKSIVNGPIQGKGFESPGATQNFLPISFYLPGLGEIQLFEGVPLDRFWTLMALSGVFLLLVIINGLLKFYINTYKGRLGERMLRRIRFDLFDRMIRFPLGQFKRMKASEAATMVKDEVEPLGGFIGDAFVSPAMLGGQALTALLFIIVQNVWLGLIAAGIVLVQGIIIPRMRKRLVRLGRMRQLTARELAGRIGEVFDGISAVRTNDTSNYERADISSRLGRIFKIRYDLYQWKFMVKFLNNFLAQVTPFLFYSLGGYLALIGRLDVGQLVAVIAAYKDLPTPLKELIDWDQERQNVEVKYAQVVEQFNVKGLIDPRVQALVTETPEPIRKPLSVVDLTHVDDGGTKVLDRAAMAVRPGEIVAVIDASGSGGENLAEAISRLIKPESGQINIGNEDISQMLEAVTGRRFAYAASDAYMFQASMRDNLLYGLKHAPVREKVYEGDELKARHWEMREAEIVGNPTFDIHSDWIDYDAINAKGPEDLVPAVQQVMEVVGLSQDVFDLGLRSALGAERHPAISERIAELRASLRDQLEAEGLTDIVVPFEPLSYNAEATVIENMIFGTLDHNQMSEQELRSHPYFRSAIETTGLNAILYEIGQGIATNVLEILGDLPPDHPFFQQGMFLTADQVPEYRSLLQKLSDRPFNAVDERDADKFIRLSFSYVEPRYRFGLLDAEHMQKIVESRTMFLEGPPQDLKDVIQIYDPEKYNHATSLLDNMLFGRIAHKQADGAEKIRTVVRKVLDEAGLYGEVIDVGLDFNVGAGGRRLTMAQRQKLNVARALLKRADYVIFNRPLSAIDLRSQEKIANAILDQVTKGDWKPAIIWVLSSPHISRFFKRIVVFERGKPVEDGSYDGLLTEQGVFAGLLAR